jgi:hypothetical protein
MSRDYATIPAIRDKSPQAVCHALRNRHVVNFVHASVKSGYVDCFQHEVERVTCMLAAALDRLAQSQSDAGDAVKLVEVTSSLLHNTFRKGNTSFWFNRGCHRYKAEIKPEADFWQMKPVIRGRTVLDYGCGSGYLAARLAQGGYEVFTTDVLDYRYPEAKHLRSCA